MAIARAWGTAYSRSPPGAPAREARARMPRADALGMSRGKGEWPLRGGREDSRCALRARRLLSRCAGLPRGRRFAAAMLCRVTVHLQVPAGCMDPGAVSEG